MRMKSVFVLLTTLCISASASAQGVGGGTNSFRYQGGSTKESCFFNELGQCANPNLRIAIPACSRQLAAQDSRNIPSNARRDRALRYAARGLAYAKQGNIARTLADFYRAIKAQDNFYWIHAFQGSALFAIGEEQEALVSINEAINLSPDNAEILNARSRLLSTALDENIRNGPQAIVDAQREISLTPGQPAYIAALATAYAENGEFENAVTTQQQAIDLFDPADPAYQGVIDAYRSRLDLYRQGMPFRREMLSCDSSDAEQDFESSIFRPLVFCFHDAA
jgi:tetratricopeptide (TPR) repeat protein